VKMYLLKNTQMKKCYFTSLLGAICLTYSFGQNIVNPDFEQVTTLPNYQQSDNTFDVTKFPTGWNTASEGSPDYFTGSSASCGGANPLNQTCYPAVCTWQNRFGQQSPKSGDSYVGFESYLSEYITTQIYTPNNVGLIAGQCYRFSYWVSRADVSEYATKIQTVISKNSLYQATTQVMGYPADAIVHTTDSFIINKVGWSQIIVDFKATGGEKFITIGLFDNNGFFDVYGNYVPTLLAESSPGDCDNSGTQATGCSNCAASGGLSYYYVDLASLQPIGAPNFPNPIVYSTGNPNITSSHSNSNILISGDVFIASNVTFTNCNVQFNAGSSITVNSNQTLTLDNAQLTIGCALMWEGIKVKPGATLVTKNYTTIQDAIVAVRCDNANWQLSNTTFNKNGQDVVLENVNSSTNNHIKGCIFNDQNVLNIAAITASGRTDYGINILSGQSNAAPVIVGGTASRENCTFVSGIAGIQSAGISVNVINSTFNSCQRGIKVTSADVNVTGSTFAYGFLGIDFSHDVTSFQKKSISVYDCNFSTTSGIYSYYKTNCSITKSKFNDCSIGVNWYSNYDCDLVVGTDSLASGLGNQFTGCTFPVMLADNKSNGISALIFNSDQPGNLNYTDILISGNSFFGVIGKQTNQCISILEFTLGSNVSYHSLEIQDNLMSEVSRGIELSNVYGMWQHLKSIQNATDSIAHSWIQNNNMSIVTTYTSTAKGINLIQSPGMKVIANGIGSDAPGHWQNNGIRSVNSQTSILVGNSIQAGTGILMAQDGMYSNIYCNSLAGNSCGINLAQTRVNLSGTYQARYNPQTALWEAFTNNFTSPTIPWTVNFQNYLSSTPDNLWVWDNTVNATSPKVWNAAANALENNMQNSSLISAPSPFSGSNPFIGQYACDYAPVFGGSDFSVPYTQSPNVRPVLANPVQQWTADYYYQGTKNSTGLGNSGNVSQKITDILAIEAAIGERDFVEATTRLNAYTPTNTVEQNYKTMLQVLVAVNYPLMRKTTEAEKNILIGIAQQQIAIGGLAVNLARAYLLANYQLMFEDSEDFAIGEVRGKLTAAANCPAGTLSGMSIVLINPANQALSVTGAKVQENGTFAFDPFQLRYLAAQNPGVTYRIAAQKGTILTVLDNTARTLDNWMAQPVLNYTYTCGNGSRLADLTQPEAAATVYPNPTNGAVTIALPEGQKATVELFSLTGQLMLNEQVNQTTVLQLDAGQVPDGVYLLKITSVSGSVQTEKLIINRK
jgi:Secretion system C-terminal sorting domain